MNIFVVGASGFQGGNIAQQLLQKKHTITTLSRSKEQSTPQGINIVKGGLEDKASLNQALTGMDAAVYTFPLIFDIDLAKEYTSNFIFAAKDQNIPLIVFNAGFDLPKKSASLLALNLKSEIKKLLDESGLNVITLVPDVYIDNISAPWSIPVILNNKIVPYPVASGTKIPWISHLDLAKYVSSAIEKPELSGGVLPIGGNLLSGEEIAEAISKEVGETLQYVPMTPDAFEKQIAPAFGELAGREISNLYRHIEINGKEMAAKDFKKTQHLLGVTPQSLTEWAQSVKWELSVS